MASSETTERVLNSSIVDLIDQSPVSVRLHNALFAAGELPLRPFAPAGARYNDCLKRWHRQ
jgi:hypothetical protein